METVLATKGTGVVTCVPSDSPDDFVTTRDLANKPEYYGIEKTGYKQILFLLSIPKNTVISVLSFG